MHFVDNENVDPKDKLKKIRNIIVYLNNKFQTLYFPGENIAIDISIMKFKGRFDYVQFNPTKRAGFGIKFYKLCDSTTGYCSLLKIYISKVSSDKPLHPSK